MNNMMPDAISSMGRAVQAKTQNMTPDQVAELDRQYSQMGLMSINDVITLKQQIDHMKQSGQPAQPPQTTVAQDLQQQVSGGGLPSLPSNVGKEQAYARGGIVAFPQGGLVDFDPMAAQRGLTSLAGAEAPVGAGVMAGAADDAAAVAAKISQAEQAAATVAPAMRKTVISRLLGGAGAAARFPIKHPMVFAALTAAPLVYSWLSGDDEEAQTAAVPEAPAAVPPMDLSALMGQARADGMSGGISMKGGIGGIPDVNGQYAGLIGAAQGRADEAKPQSREDMMKMMDERYSGLTGHIDKRGEEIAADAMRLTNDRKNDVWEAAAKGFFSMAAASGKDGATIGGAAAEGALAGMEDYRALTDKYDDAKKQLDAQRFAMGEAQASHKRGIISSTDAEERHREEMYENKQNQLLALQKARVDALLSAQSHALDNQTRMAIAMAGEKGLTGLELLTHAATIAGMKGGKDSPAFVQLTGLINEITGIAPAVQAARIRSESGMDPMMMGGGTEGFRVVGSRPVQ